MYKLKVNDPNFLPHVGCNVEFLINRGELLTLVGENGVGKTSLIQRFCRENRALVSLAEQKTADFFYDRTLGRIKDIFLKSYKSDINLKSFNQYWNSFKLHTKQDRFQSSLSGGEAQALKLCFALSINRDIYVLDEPSQYLDDYSKMELSNILNQLLSTGKAIVLIEHDTSWIQIPMSVSALEIEGGSLIKGRTWNT
jgi:ABC-type multidrug transport system ATPase subunit